MGTLDSDAQDSYRGRTYYLLLATFLAIVTVAVVGSMYFIILSFGLAREKGTEALDLAMRSYDCICRRRKPP